MNKVRIDIVGSGNLAWHLEQSFKSKADVNMVNPHLPAEVRFDSEFIIICVKDDVISDVVAGLPDVSGIVCHTSGATDISVIPSCFNRRGVFYPLNTFTKGLPVNMLETPIFVEASDAETLCRLERVGRMISGNVRHADSCRREILHIGAVLSCNYVNRLWALADSLLENSGLDFDLLKPLISSTFIKMLNNKPADVQTGPAARHDMKTVMRHINRLTGTPIEPIYRELANNIMNENN